MDTVVTGVNCCGPITNGTTKGRRPVAATVTSPPNVKGSPSGKVSSGTWMVGCVEPIVPVVLGLLSDVGEDEAQVLEADSHQRSTTTGCNADPGLR